MTIHTNLFCECCNTELIADFCNNVWCENKECILYDKCFVYDFLIERKIARENNEKIPIKDIIRERL